MTKSKQPIFSAFNSRNRKSGVGERLDKWTDNQKRKIGTGNMISFLSAFRYAEITQSVFALKETYRFSECNEINIRDAVGGQHFIS